MYSGEDIFENHFFNNEKVNPKELVIEQCLKLIEEVRSADKCEEEQFNTLSEKLLNIKNAKHFFSVEERIFLSLCQDLSKLYKMCINIFMEQVDREKLSEVYGKLFFMDESGMIENLEVYLADKLTAIVQTQVVVCQKYACFSEERTKYQDKEGEFSYKKVFNEAYRGILRSETRNINYKNPEPVLQNERGIK